MGFLVLLEGFFMLAGYLFSLLYCRESCNALLISGFITASAGAILLFVTRGNINKHIGKREGYIIVSLTWVIVSLFGTLPFLISGAIPEFTDAFFETMSGFTTTGASILTDVESLPKGLLFWRSMTHWVGGMGIIVLTIAILPMLGIGGMQLYAAEMPGPTKDKLHPRITQTAKRLWGIYLILTIAETILLVSGGMNLFDALCHTFGTLATGGFSTQNTSIAGYSPFIQYVIIVFMILAGTSFTLHYFALHGQLKKIWRNEEFRYFIYLIFFSGLIITLSLTILSVEPIEKAIRDSLFQVVSIITTTGYITANYMLWPGVLWFIIFMLMFVGGMAGSTGGGIKVVRQLLLFKNSTLELKRLIHPNAIIPVRLSGKVVSGDIIYKIMAFFLIYMIIFVFGTLFMSILGLDFESAIGSTVATLGNIGPGIGMVGPGDNYAEIPIIGKWFLSFLMLLGRLELFTILILFSKAFWKK
ncbi:MAG: TrkH family potassium uptake protein [Bacteroidetes bacterium]|nr:TrkH family potassium uptake protein [Bacteroidota bacterium]